MFAFLDRDLAQRSILTRNDSSPLRASNALPTLSTTYYPNSHANQRQRIYEYESKRGNMLEFNNFRMVNLVNVVSPWCQSLTSIRGFKVSSSL